MKIHLKRTFNGFLLIEAIVYVACASVLISAVMMATIGLIRSSSYAARRAIAFQGMERLRSRLIEDLALCEETSLEEEGTVLVMNLKSGEILRWQPSSFEVGIVRVTDSEPRQRELFMRTGSLKFEIYEHNGRQAGVLVDVNLSGQVYPKTIVPDMNFRFSAFPVVP